MAQNDYWSLLLARKFVIDLNVVCLDSHCVDPPLTLSNLLVASDPLAPCPESISSHLSESNQNLFSCFKLFDSIRPLNKSSKGFEIFPEAHQHDVIVGR